MKASACKACEKSLLILNAATVARVLGISPEQSLVVPVKPCVSFYRQE